MSTTYLSTAETAKLIRQALKESFPGIKFSVRCHHRSVNVGWTDGPNPAQVQAVTGAFEAAYFDGMIDYQGARYHKLDGAPVRFGANYVFERREHSDALIERAIRFVRGKYGISDEITVEAFRCGGLYSKFPCGGEWAANHNSLQSMLNRALSKMSDRAAPESSATLARIQSDGDDGYGAGTVGSGSGGEQCYKAIANAQAKAREQEAGEAARCVPSASDFLRQLALAVMTPVGGVQ